MAGSLRIEFPGAIYDISVRMLGNWKTESNLLFEDDADRHGFIDRLSDRMERFHIRLGRTTQTDPLVIVTQPEDQSVVQGDTATFTVVATGTEPLSYQWREYENAFSFTVLSAARVTPQPVEPPVAR